MGHVANVPHVGGRIAGVGQDPEHSAAHKRPPLLSKLHSLGAYWDQTQQPCSHKAWQESSANWGHSQPIALTPHSCQAPGGGLHSAVPSPLLQQAAARALVTASG